MVFKPKSRIAKIRATCLSQFILLELIMLKFGEEYKLWRSPCNCVCIFLTSYPLGQNTLSTLFSNTLNLNSSLNVTDRVLHPQKSCKINLYVLGEGPLWKYVEVAAETHSYP
jgi:hypothetical protein